MLACLIESCLFPKGKHIHLAGRIVGTYFYFHLSMMFIVTLPIRGVLKRSRITSMNVKWVHSKDFNLKKHFVCLFCSLPIAREIIDTEWYRKILQSRNSDLNSRQLCNLSLSHRTCQ